MFDGIRFHIFDLYLTKLIFKRKITFTMNNNRRNLCKTMRKIFQLWMNINELNIEQTFSISSLAKSDQFYCFNDQRILETCLVELSNEKRHFISQSLIYLWKCLEHLSFIEYFRWEKCWNLQINLIDCLNRTKEMFQTR